MDLTLKACLFKRKRLLRWSCIPIGLEEILTLRSEIVGVLERNHVYWLLYGLFILGFFVSPSVRWHNNFYYALIIPLYLISLRKGKFQIFFHSKIWLLSMLLALYFFLTVFWAQNPGEEGVLYYLRRPVYLFVFLSLTMELVLRYPKFVDHLFVFVAWVGTIMAVISIFCFYASASFPAARLVHFADQLHGEIEGGIIHGMIALVIYFYILKRVGGYWKALYFIFMGILLGAALLSQSRGPVGSLLIAFFAGALITRDKKLLISFGCAMVIIIALFLNVEPFQKAVTQRGWSARIELGQKILARADNSIYFGKGISTNNDFVISSGKKLPHTHNVYLGALLYGGIAGLLLFLGLLALAFLQALKHFYISGDIVWFLLILFAAACIVTGQDKLLTHPNSMWLFFWLPLGLVAGVLCRAENGEIPVHAGFSRQNGGGSTTSLILTKNPGFRSGTNYLYNSRSLMYFKNFEKLELMEMTKP